MTRTDDRQWWKPKKNSLSDLKRFSAGMVGVALAAAIWALILFNLLGCSAVSPV